MRGYHSPGSGRITAPGSSWPQSTRMVQRKRRPTSNVDSAVHWRRSIDNVAIIQLDRHSVYHEC